MLARRREELGLVAKGKQQLLAAASRLRHAAGVGGDAQRDESRCCALPRRADCRMTIVMDPLEKVFQHRDRWRHLPNYQLERRADVFFSVYLASIVEAFTGVALKDKFLPEFPLKRDLIRLSEDRRGRSIVLFERLAAQLAWRLAAGAREPT